MLQALSVTTNADLYNMSACLVLQHPWDCHECCDAAEVALLWAPLCTGLLFGVGSDVMVEYHISAFLPQLNQRYATCTGCW
jgi:hypothetical protein